MSSLNINPIEAERITAVLEDTREKLAFLHTITPDILARREEAAALVGEEIGRIIAEQRSLELRYNNLIEQRANLKGLANKSKFKAVQIEINDVSIKLRDSLRTLCRSLKDNPDVSDNLTRVAEERESLNALLGQTITDLHSGNYHTLAELVYEDTHRREQLSAVATKEDSLLSQVEKLTTTLKDEENRHNYDMEVKRAEIATLKERLRKLKVDTSLTLRYARKEVAAKNETLSKQYVGDETEITKEIEILKNKILVENTAHEASMELTKQDQEEYLKKIEEWKNKHLADLASKQEELKLLTEQRDHQRIELIRLQERYESDLQAMVEKMTDAERRQAEILAAGEEEARRKVAATQLQKILGDMFLTIKAVADVAAAAKAAKGGKKK